MRNIRKLGGTWYIMVQIRIVSKDPCRNQSPSSDDVEHPSIHQRKKEYLCDMRRSAYITYKVRTESPARNMMTDSITHVSRREKPPTDVIPLCVGDLCPRSSLRVSEAACTLGEYAHVAISM